MLQTNVRRSLITVAAVGMALLWNAPPASAQAGDRYRVLVPALAPQGDISDRFGERVADELRDIIGDMATHRPVERGDLRRALRQFDLKEEALSNCVTARQLASQIDAQLVLCGSYSEVSDNTYEVHASFHSSETDDVFQVPAFTVNERETEQAARQIQGAFEQWVTQLSLAVYCAQYVESHQWDNALTNCNQALEINPTAISPLYNKAYALMQQGKLEESLVYFNKVLEQNPIHKDALLSAGIVNARLNRREQAREFFDRYMELEPGNVEVRITVATDIANQGAPLEALRIAREGLEMEPDNLTLLTYIGHFAATAANKVESEMRDERGQLTGDPSELMDLYNTAVESYTKVYQAEGDTTGASILQRMIVALTKLERTDEAVNIGQEATTIYPDSALVWDAYARALEKAGQAGQAIQALNKVAQLDTTARIMGRKANLLLQEDRLDEAVQAFTQAVGSGELTQDQAFNAMFGYGYQQKYQKDQHDAALDVFQAARTFAQNERTQSTLNFWTGYILFQRGIAMQEPSTLESAQQSLPVFQRALEAFQNARGYEQVQSNIDVQRFIDNTNQYIEIQEALIKRGRRG